MCVEGRGQYRWRDQAEGGLAYVFSAPSLHTQVGLEVMGDTKPAGEEGADEKLEIISVVDILAIVALEQGKLSAPSMFNLKCKLFALRNRRSIERDEELDVPKLASAVPLSKLSKRSRPKVHELTQFQILQTADQLQAALCAAPHASSTKKF